MTGGFPTSQPFGYGMCNCLIGLLTITTSLRGSDPLQSYIWTSTKVALLSLAQHVHSESRAPGKGGMLLLSQGELGETNGKKEILNFSGIQRDFLKEKQLINV